MTKFPFEANNMRELSISEFRALLADPPSDHAPKVRLPVETLQWILDNLNTCNRKEKPKVHKRIMEHGYQDIGGIIGFDLDGILADGQNRIASCIKLNVSMDTYVAFKIAKSARLHIDDGARRTPGDNFAIMGVKNPQCTADAVRWIINYIPGKIPSRESYGSATLSKEYQKLDQSGLATLVSLAVKYARPIPAGMLAGNLYLAFIRGHAKSARVFLQQLEAGTRRGRAHALKNKIWEARQGGQRPTDIAQNAWIIEALCDRAPAWTTDQPYPAYAIREYEDKLRAKAKK
jgi:hypothetical protein